MEIKGLIDEHFVHTVIRKRPKDVHKGDCGRVLITAGSREMAGAAVLCAKAALKSGSGLVKVCTHKKVFPVLQSAVPEATCTSWGKVKQDPAVYDAVALGPGMGVGRKTKKILRELLTCYTKTIVIDADGLNAVAEEKSLQQLLRNTGASVIITPHIGEAKRLLNGEYDGFAGGMSKPEIGQALQEKYNCIVVVKGEDTLVALSEKDAYINTTGNPGMAAAGSGDVLTGMITSLAGQGLSAEDAARAGVFLHGLAGDLAAGAMGEYGMTAGDIVSHVPFALKKFTE